MLLKVKRYKIKVFITSVGLCPSWRCWNLSVLSCFQRCLPSLTCGPFLHLPGQTYRTFKSFFLTAACFVTSSLTLTLLPPPYRTCVIILGPLG